MTEKQKVAVFDIDGTIFRSSLLIELVDTLIAEGIFDQNTPIIYEREKNEWRDRKAEYGAYINAVVSAFEQNIVGVDKKVFDAIVKKVINIHKNRVYRFTRDLVKDLTQKDYFLLAISHSPKEVVDDFCKHLGFDKVYARIYEVDEENKFTGAVPTEKLINNKGEILQRAIEKEGLTLKGSYGVGDTKSDIFFLELVENPICFNPSSNLCRHAKEKGWEVVVERKDMIYKF